MKKFDFDRFRFLYFNHKLQFNYILALNIKRYKTKLIKKKKERGKRWCSIDSILTIKSSRELNKVKSWPKLFFFFCSFNFLIFD